MKPVDYSVVVPVYNSRHTLRPLFERIKSLFDRLGNSFQVVFVDDESKDNSWQEIMHLKDAYPSCIKAIRLAQNCGQQKATLCGINNSEGKVVITIDDDLQTPPEEIEKLISTYRGSHADLVYGIYQGKKHSFVRNAGSWFFNKLFRKLASTSGQGSSFRLLSGELADRLGGINQKYLLLDEVLQWFTSNISYCTVEHHWRTEGKSGYSIFKLVRMTLGYLVYYTVFPLRMMTYIGFISSLASFIGGIVYIYNRVRRGDEVVVGFTTIIVAISFSTSIILFSLGIIGEYISRIYVQEVSKPPYVIKEIQ
ncbi:MAG TPA: glycosyltransferase family 2 protein [Chitinophagales bacterium]|nr:glycosyltransferase family 2 protein [Chitinophagales bacterium]